MEDGSGKQCQFLVFGNEPICSNIHSSRTVLEITTSYSVRQFVLQDKLPQNLWLKTSTIYVASNFADQQFRLSLTGQFWS